MVRRRKEKTQRERNAKRNLILPDSKSLECRLMSRQPSGARVASALSLLRNGGHE
jgi:hypothetical protein